MRDVTGGKAGLVVKGEQQTGNTELCHIHAFSRSAGWCVSAVARRVAPSLVIKHSPAGTNELRTDTTDNITNTTSQISNM
ncbi:hypothetical protein E2C01_095274 [Portunus trituberculatus]|uniref:Uncharacterized protein n=1 Tax=Portunus trituberculatus TaxID=210409 RepID=A0A5B7JZR5_PORTR|nr:hypothetical protein [Portunus trituberculatus]